MSIDIVLCAHAPSRKVPIVTTYLKVPKSQHNPHSKILRRKNPDISTMKMSKKEPRKRTKIKGHYMQVRQRSTKIGKKGTIMGKWKPEKKTTKKKKK